MVDKGLSLKRIVKSEVDNTIKYIFYRNIDKAILEFSYINKNDGKDIICVPCQTMCDIGCKFCHATDHIGKIRKNNLNRNDISDGVNYIYEDLELINAPKTLLISFMGIGEPVLNVDGVIESMLEMQRVYSDKGIYIRFAIATSLPKRKTVEFFKMTKYIKSFKLPTKLHVSLHYTENELRNSWMPNALDIESTIAAAEFYKVFTGNPVEIHYALIEGVNDFIEDAVSLSELIVDKDFNVKFLFYNEKQSLGLHPSEIKQFEIFKKVLNEYDIECEYYKPPGLDVGASCGQFLMDEYIN